MSEVVIHDNEYITVRYLPEKKIVYHTVHQPVSGSLLREGLSAGFKALKEHGISKWLSDERKAGPMSEDDQAWADQNLDPRADDVNWKYWALVVPEAVAAAGALVPAIEAYYQIGLRLAVFTNVEEALAWLDEQAD